VLVTAGLFWLAATSEYPGGMRWDYPAKDFDPRLTSIAKTALPIMDALEKHRAATGCYPDGYAEVKQYLADWNSVHARDTANCYQGWCYSKSLTGYHLARSLGWDPALAYDSESNGWEFVPGDGSPGKPIKLNLK
jgi:hypothetical protein